MKVEQLTYEQAFKELEQVVEELEKDELTLSDSLEKFKRGVELYNYCNKILKEMEGEIKILTRDDEGNIREDDFYLEV